MVWDQNIIFKMKWNSILASHYNLGRLPNPFKIFLSLTINPQPLKVAKQAFAVACYDGGKNTLLSLRGVVTEITSY